MLGNSKKGHIISSPRFGFIKLFISQKKKLWVLISKTYLLENINKHDFTKSSLIIFSMSYFLFF